MASPHPLPSSSDAPAERRRSDRARMALVQPWSRRRARRVGLIAVVLGVLGPILGTAVALLLVPAQPGDILTTTEQPSVLDVRGSIRSVDPVTGEASLRLVIERSLDLDAEAAAAVFAEDGTLREDVSLLVNDANGQGTHVLPAGSAPGTVTVTLPLADSRATRYPLDRYTTTVLVVAQRGAEAEVVPLRFSLRSSDPGFTVKVAEDRSTDDAAVIDLRVARRGTVIGWAAFFVLVCWLLAIAAASIGWTTVVHGIATPAWAWGFLIGVLFALPPLRNALPGAPPSGSLVDLAAFYWAVGIVALTLVAMIGSWNVRVRRAPHEPDAPRPRI